MKEQENYLININTNKHPFKQTNENKQHIKQTNTHKRNKTTNAFMYSFTKYLKTHSYFN